MSSTGKNPFSGVQIKWDDLAVQEIVELLAGEFDSKEQIKRILRAAGMMGGRVAYSLPPYLLWPEILNQAHGQDVIPRLFEEIKKANAPIGRRIDELLSDRPVLAARVIAAPSADWRGGEEAILGNGSTLLGIEFLSQGLDAAAAVCRLAVAARGALDTWGSGFLIAPDLVLTNHHVLYPRGAVGRAEKVAAWFQFRPGDDEVCILGKASTIDGRADHDWAVIELERDVTEAKPLRLGTHIPIADKDPAFIIQHPGGGPKKVGLYRNEIRFISDDVIQYLTDTSAGSSGSPVLNRAWDVIALHHRWIEAEGQAGTPRAKREMRNQGVRIERVIQGLASIGIRQGSAEEAR